MAMGKRFRTDHINQSLLLPPSLHDWLPEGHLGRFIADVTEELDLGVIYRSYEGDGRGLRDWGIEELGDWDVSGLAISQSPNLPIPQSQFPNLGFRI